MPILLAAVLAVGCEPVAPPVSGPACGTIGFSREIEVSWSDALHLVLVVDNTPGMERPQQTLMRELPRVLRALLSGDRDGDGIAEEASLRSIHLGVITTDMGTGINYASSFAGCQTPTGDDGLIGVSTAESHTPSFLAFASTDALGELDAEARQAIDVGTAGCIFRQPFEAALKAITGTGPVHTGDDPRAQFRDATTGEWTAPGHASDAHADFFRRGAALAVIVMTNGDDCSARDERILMNSPEINAALGSDPRLRCARSQSALHAIQRYADGLGFSRGFPGFSGPPAFVFGAIVGIPEEWATDYWSYTNLSDPRVDVVETGDATNPIRDACRSEDGNVRADPPTRILAFHDMLTGAGMSSIASICSDDFGPAFQRVMEATRWSVGENACLPRALARNADGLVTCEITETLPPARLAEFGVATRCIDVAGREFIGMTTIHGEPREQCRVVQIEAQSASAPGAVGWAYEDAQTTPSVVAYCAATPQRIRFTQRGRPAGGSLVRLDCTYPACSAFVGMRCSEDVDVPCERGMSCDPLHDVCDARRSQDSSPLQCDAIERLCAVSCTTDSDCDAALLEGHVCDVRTYGEAATGETYEGLTSEQRTQVRGVCVNPSCEP